MFARRYRLPVVNLAAVPPGARSELMAAVSGEGEVLPGNESGAANRLEEYSWKVLTRLEELDTLARDWRNLLPEEAAQFQSFSWVRAWYRSCADVCDTFLIFVVFKHGRPAAIFPCYRHGQEIRLAGDLDGDFQGVIANNEEAVRFGLGLFVTWVRRKQAGCEVFFEKLSHRGLLYSALEEMNPSRARYLVFRRKLSRGHDLVSSVRLLPRTIPNTGRYFGLTWKWGIRAVARRLGWKPGASLETPVGSEGMRMMSGQPNSMRSGEGDEPNNRQSHHSHTNE